MDRQILERNATVLCEGSEGRSESQLWQDDHFVGRFLEVRPRTSGRLSIAQLSTTLK